MISLHNFLIINVDTNLTITITDDVFTCIYADCFYCIVIKVRIIVCNTFMQGNMTVKAEFYTNTC